MSQYVEATHINELTKKIDAYLARGHNEADFIVYSDNDIPELLNKYPHIRVVIIEDETLDTSALNNFSDEDLIDISALLNNGGFLLFIKDDETDLNNPRRTVITDEPKRVQLKEEKLIPSKRKVDAGEVNVKKTVKTREETLDVPVHSEDVTVERRTFEDAPLLSDYNNFEDNDDVNVTRIPITRERIRVVKEQIVTEEIIIRKEIHEDIKHISDTIRYDDIEIEKYQNNHKKE